jgi:hypothetical protein
MVLRSDKTYTITEEQRHSIEQLDLAARLISAGLPPAYTQTPVGSLAELAEAVGMWMLFLEPNETIPKTAL